MRSCKGIMMVKMTMMMIIMMMMLTVTTAPKYIHEPWPGKLSVNVQRSIMTPALFSDTVTDTDKVDVNEQW